MGWEGINEDVRSQSERSRVLNHRWFFVLSSALRFGPANLLLHTNVVWLDLMGERQILQ